MRRLLLILLLAMPAFASYTKNVAVVIYEGVEILDFGGPAEVFSAAGNFGANDGERAFHVYTVSRTKAPIVSQGFIDITPDYSIDDAPKPDIIVIPGGNSRSVTDDAVWLEWVRKSGADAQNILTVCTGAFVAGKAGFLDNADATTFYRALPGLEREFPNTRVKPGTRFVDNGKIITTAGVSAGIDGSLHLVARLLGRWVADRTAEYMEYKWSPESLHASKYPLLNPQLDARGRALQEAAIERDANPDAAIAIYRAQLAEKKDDAQTWLELGRVLHAQKRYTEAIAANEQAAKGEKQRAIALFNISCSLALLGQNDKAIDAATRAVDAGARSKSLYQDDDLVALRDDARFKALVATLN